MPLLPSLLLAANALTLDPSAATLPATATPPAPSRAAVTLYWENDGNWVKPIGRTDRHYTAGVGLSVAAQSQFALDLARFIPSFWDQFNPNNHHNSFALGFVAVLDINTPSDITAPIPNPNDRPYAGFLFGGFYLQRANYQLSNNPGTTDNYLNHACAPATFEHIQLDLGIIGPSSQAEDAQTWIHQTFGYTIPQGWSHQLQDEPGIDFTYVRKWRWTKGLSEIGYFQLIPETGFTVGSVHDEAIAGATLRLAYFSPPDDFGPTRLHQPSALTGLAPADNIGFSIFARPVLHLVAYNELIQGNTFRDSPPGAGVGIHPLVGELQAGLSLQLLKHIDLTYSVTWRTPESSGQHSCDSWGSLALTAFWTF